MTKLTFLGTGTSQGVPIIGCHCPVCSSQDPRDKRFRSAAYIEHEGLQILVDAGPDFRQQMIAHDICHLDAILLTHNHKDHTGGLDDVRSLNYIDKRSAEIFCEEYVHEALAGEYPYAFAKDKYPGAPEWHMHIISNRPFEIKSDREDKELVWVHNVGYRYQLPDGTLLPTGTPVETAPPIDSAHLTGSVIIPIRGYHGQLPVFGYRFGDIAYITDMSSIPEEEFDKLRDLKHLTLNTVGFKPHHSHFSFDQTLELADRIGAEHTWLTHLSHAFPVHEEFCKLLERTCAERGIRSIVRPAYDGLTIE